MPKVVACAVIRDDPPTVLVAEDLETLNWVLALKLIAQTKSRELPEGLRDRLRNALREERWGDAVELWITTQTEVDVYPSHELFGQRDIELAEQELEFTPLFQD
jgi:hypothetical protein